VQCSAVVIKLFCLLSREWACGLNNRSACGLPATGRTVRSQENWTKVKPVSFFQHNTEAQFSVVGTQISFPLSSLWWLVSSSPRLSLGSKLLIDPAWCNGDHGMGMGGWGNCIRMVMRGQYLHCGSWCGNFAWNCGFCQNFYTNIFVCKSGHGLRLLFLVIITNRPVPSILFGKTIGVYPTLKISFPSVR
jgi:hypothetical protein